ncbi:GAF domain-containing protein [Actinomadura coerulea]|uniref:GAF domain-containing protein n=1 Tax=Actinomadura coerulea TaxID=46159 RepID=A0A7X0G4Y7_9ACTN|nr:GAF domain-containing protein [Actinomadura coerulea]MBB6399493.1 GAF domain-containing protein [Actinomadura coerulea]GGQ13355.1 GAF domain-containing protein [Actinomadura coerulea]
MTDPLLREIPDLRPPHLADALAEITSQLTGGPDSATVLRLVTDAGTGMLGAAATGVMLVDPRGGVEVVAASDRPARFVELLQTQTEQGPCLDCIATGAIVTAQDLESERARWPAFVPAAVEMGYRAVAAVPLRLDGQAMGGLNLLYGEPTSWPVWHLRLAQVVSDLAVLGLVQEHGDRRADRLAERTMTVLNDLVHLDHAVGMVAGTLDLDPDAARSAIMSYARRLQRPLLDVARAVTQGDLNPADLTADRPG